MTQDESANVLEASALFYAERFGWKVIPLHEVRDGRCSCTTADCEPGNYAKHPRTRSGLSDGSSDPAQVKWWWTKWPDANIGVLTGTANGICALDVDPRHGGDESLDDLQRIHGRLPDTVEAISGGEDRGRHLYFAIDAPLQGLNGLAPGLDLKAEGGYLVAPPSTHRSGRRYEWEASSRPEEVALAPLPLWVRELRSAKQSRPCATEQGEDRIPSGYRHSALVSFAGTMRRRGLTESEMLGALFVVNGERCDPPLTEPEVRLIAKTIARYAPADAPQFAVIAAAASTALSDGARAIKASTIRRQHVEYLDAARSIPLRAATVLAGPPGLGKSQFTVWLAAQNPGVTLIATAEDSVDAVVRPRLEAAGADLERAHFVVMRREGIDEGLDLPDDVGGLRRLVQENTANLVIIDPLMAHLPESVNSWRDQSVRRALAPLHRLAEELDCAIVVVVHLNKREGDDPMMRVGGSVGIAAAARSVLLLARDPDDPEGEAGSRRVLAHIKSNYGPLRPSLALRIEGFLLDPEGERIDTSRIVVTGESPHLGRDLLAVGDREDSGKRGDALSFLIDALRDGPVSPLTVIDGGKTKGLSERTIRRAKRDLGVMSEKAGFGSGWNWAMPAPKVAKGPSSEDGHGGVSELAIFGGTTANIDVPAPPGPEDGQPTTPATFDDRCFAPWPTAWPTVASIRAGRPVPQRQSHEDRLPATMSSQIARCGICGHPAIARCPACHAPLCGSPCARAHAVLAHTSRRSQPRARTGRPS